MTPLQKLSKNVGDLGKLIVAKGFKKLPKVKKIAQSGHTDGRRCDTQEEERLFRFRSFLIFAKTFLASKCALTCFFLKKWAITDLF